MKKFKQACKKIIFVLFCFQFTGIYAQLIVSTSSNYKQLLDSLVLYGVSISNVSYSGNASACGSFINGSLTSLGLNSGAVLSTGQVTDIMNGPAYEGSFSFFNGGDTSLTKLTGIQTNDAAVLEFDVVPNYDTLTFSYIFGSEDYPENVGTSYFDPLAAFISGSNPKGGTYVNENFIKIPGTSLLVNVNTINIMDNSGYFVDTNSVSKIMFDAHTTVMDAKISVVPFSTYHIKIAIADGGDYVFDSGVFLKNKSLASYATTTNVSDIVFNNGISVKGNPLTEKSSVNFRIGNTEKVTMDLYDMAGRLINQLTNQEYVEGNHSVPLSPWGLQTGIYILKLCIGNQYYTSKIVVD